MGGNSDGGVFTNYDHLDKRTGNLNDETMATVDEEDQAGDQVDADIGMTPFASSQFYKNDAEGQAEEDVKVEDEDDEHITEF